MVLSYIFYVFARFNTAYGLYANKDTRAIKTTKNWRPIALNTTIRSAEDFLY